MLFFVGIGRWTSGVGSDQLRHQNCPTSPNLFVTLVIQLNAIIKSVNIYIFRSLPVYKTSPIINPKNNPNTKQVADSLSACPVAKNKH